LDQRPRAAAKSDSRRRLCPQRCDRDFSDGGAAFAVVFGRDLRAGGRLCGNGRSAGGFAGGGTFAERAAWHGVRDTGGSERGGGLSIEHCRGGVVVRGLGEGGVFIFGGVVFCGGDFDREVAEIGGRALRRQTQEHSQECFFQAEDGIRDATVTGVQTCALPI